MKKQQNMSLAALFYVLAIVVCLRSGCGSIVEGYSGRSCVASEKQGLLQFKRGLSDEFNYLSSWVGNDCCAWHGVACNNKSTRHVTKLDLRNCSLRGDRILHPSLLDLKYLTYLDLSYNYFDGIQVPDFFGSFKDLIYLNLSYSNFEGSVPHHIGNLSSLRYLDLSGYYQHADFSYYPLLSIDDMGWLSGLSHLEHLDLSTVDLSKVTDHFQAINMLPNSILVLTLRDCELPNNIADYPLFMNLTSLVSLDLGWNGFSSLFPVWVFNNSGLVHLNLRGNYFSGTITNSIGRLTALLELDLFGNNFQGLIPESIGALTSLTNLDLSGNNFQGLIPESIGALTSLTNLDLSGNNFQGLIPKSVGYLALLSKLDLSSNRLYGSIPPEIGNLKELTHLYISFNKLRGFLPEAFCKLSKLQFLFVNENQLSGTIPKCIGELSKLITLDLYSNLWEGFVSEYHFVNLTRLTWLSISSRSNLVLNISSKWFPPFQLQYLSLESLKVGPKFPRWLLTQRQIWIIMMRNTSISDTIPADWFVSILSQASRIDLSNNEINVAQLSLISEVSNGLYELILSNNRLSSEFPAFLCNITSLSTLILSNNNLSGELPHCLGNLKELINFDVMSNNLSGVIPLSLGSLGKVSYLNLYNNKFHGTLPKSFQYLTELVVLDVGKNNLRDILPPWTGKQLPNLRYLLLRSNNFYGEIPTQLCDHSPIQVLNLAQNKITGDIPPCFGNLSAIKSGISSDGYYHNLSMAKVRAIIDDVKGYELKYTSTLEYLFSIDLSNNIISGKIPEELMNLHGLLNLNLAGNYLSGRIPDRIGDLKLLESLDLSRNKLYGPIPQSLSDLNFLSRLNLSFNSLSGRIPTGNQLQTLDDFSIYVGNNQLCGQPVQKPCDTESHSDYNKKEADYVSDSNSERIWFYAGIGPGLLVGFMGFCASLHFIDSWRYLYFQSIERTFDRIALSIALLRRNFRN